MDFFICLRGIRVVILRIGFAWQASNTSHFQYELFSCAAYMEWSTTETARRLPGFTQVLNTRKSTKRAHEQSVIH